MKMMPFVFLATLSLSACDSKQEQARRSELDARANKLESEADTAKKAAAAKAEILNTEAEKLRAQKP